MIKVGVFFGGISREREVSFAGGRTVYDNLDKNLFEAIPIFVDSFNRFIELDWQYVYKGSIRDFYPPVSHLPKSTFPYQIYAEHIASAYETDGLEMAKKIGKVIPAEHLKDKIDIAFLALHGLNGEDGSIQGLLEWLKIPYTGSGILPSAFGMNKRIQKEWTKATGMAVPVTYAISRQQWLHEPHDELLKHIRKSFGPKVVVKPANQGSSVGVSVVSTSDVSKLEEAIYKAFFILDVTSDEWKSLTTEQRHMFAQKVADVKEGIGLPCEVEGKWIYHPQELVAKLTAMLRKKKSVQLQGYYAEPECLIESFIEGREFSCIVIRDAQGKPIALPPTEIIKGNDVFDYRSKYLPGLSRKITPIDLPEHAIAEIRTRCESLFSFFQFHVYARIDGFIGSDGTIYLNDPNTTSGMMPSSFFFHQAAEIGLNPSQFLTYIIRTSLAERKQHAQVLGNETRLLQQLDAAIAKNKSAASKKIRVAVMMGGYSTERHISVESGRNIYEKLASSTKYEPFPVFVTGNNQAHELYRIPINVMLKDNADDIREKAMQYNPSPVIKQIAQQCSELLATYGSAHALDKPQKLSYKQLASMCDCVFIALHGRPGEDGTIQQELDKLGIPYNGSGVASSQITINKFETNKLLRKKGFLVADHLLLHADDWQTNQKKCVKEVESIGYPLIAKPADDGCSSAVKKIKSRTDLIHYADGVFRNTDTLDAQTVAKLQLKPNEEFPRKPYFLVEKFVEKGKAGHFLEITGGMLTHMKKGKRIYETFEPSEALAESEILSLEEKFLAGQGQNITPARYDRNEKRRKQISAYVQQELKKAAKVLGVEGYCRIDAFVRIMHTRKIEVVFIEVNSLPGMTPATAIFHQCALNGYKPYEFIDAILTYGMQRSKLQHG